MLFLILLADQPEGPKSQEAPFGRCIRTKEPFKRIGSFANVTSLLPLDSVLDSVSTAFGLGLDSDSVKVVLTKALLRVIMISLHISLLLFLTRVLEIQSSVRPRLEFTKTDISMKSIPLPKRINQEHVQLIEDGTNSVIIVNAGHQLYSLDFQHNFTQTYHVLESRSESAHQQHKLVITVLHKRRGTNHVFVCATIDTETWCCNMELSSPSVECSPSPSVQKIAATIKAYRLKAGEPSLFIESPENDELYITQSSTENSIGIYKFGLNQVRPTMPDKAVPVEHQYLGMVAISSNKIQHIGDKTQDKLYTFFKEKNTAGGLESDAWLPFVAQVCMADKGGTKAKLQYQWTSQLRARLFCGDQAQRRHYPELVDVAFHRKEDDEVSRVYALFRNEWRMSAVCVYSIESIQKVFETSAFKGNKESIPDPRPGTCTQDNQMKRLIFVQSHPEMEDRVFSMDDQPLLVSQHHYTHILLDVINNEGDNHTLLYLSLESGKIHKVLDNKMEAFLMTEYSPFTRRTHILGMTLHTPKRKLYVSSSDEVVQLDVESCATYGQHCEDCVLARDPYCGWDETLLACVSATRKTLQDVEKGNPAICQSGKGYKGSSSPVPDQSSHAWDSPPSRFVLQCPITSRHAEYTWHHPETNATTTCSTTQPQCVLLVDGKDPEEEGVYRCMAYEQGYTKTLALVHLQVEKSGTPLAPVNKIFNQSIKPSTPRAWICVVVLLVSVLGEAWL